MKIVGALYAKVTEGDVLSELGSMILDVEWRVVEGWPSKPAGCGRRPDTPADARDASGARGRQRRAALSRAWTLARDRGSDASVPAMTAGHVKHD